MCTFFITFLKPRQGVCITDYMIGKTKNLYMKTIKKNVSNFRKDQRTISRETSTRNQAWVADVNNIEPCKNISFYLII